MVANQKRNWTEDFPHENGKYLCKCVYCEEQFFGHKRRVLCKVCQEVRNGALEDVAKMAQDRAENASATALELHAKKKLPESTKTVYRALYMHFTSLANEIRNQTVN